MNLLLKPNFERLNALQGTQMVIEACQRYGLTPMLSAEDYSFLQEPEHCISGNLEALQDVCDIIVPIGGDGTVLTEVGRSRQCAKPYLGINAGRIGFLTQLELTDLDYLQCLNTGKYQLSRRFLLESRILREDGNQVYYALNDVVVRREDTNRILDISVFRNEQLLLRQRADGIIFATPTGSTAYSLSAGGPVVEPEQNVILLTPICPHSTSRCSMVLPGEHVYRAAEVHGHDISGYILSVDGILVERVTHKEQVEIRRSEDYIELIDFGYRDFYSYLNEKLVTL